ncbi:MAG: fibronectin type III domain-containing protein, partial [Chloroflexi bacterium]|nr:fibronectin type III domain-containing protein [Chloroflexota bacterium]
MFHAAPAEAGHTLPTPTNLQAQAGNGQVTLTWAGGENHWNYDVAHGEHPSGTLSTQFVISTANRTVTITGLTNGTTYRFRVRVRATQGHSVSAWTDFVTATPSAQQATAPAAPTNLSVTPGDAHLTLRWTAPTGTLTGYDVHYTSAPATGNGAVTNSATASGSSPATAWVDANYSFTSNFVDILSLTNGTLYRVRVRAKNSGGNGAWVFGSGTPELFLQWPNATFSMAESLTPGEQIRIGPSGASVAVSGTLTYAAGSSNPASLADDLTSGYATTFSAAANANPTTTLAVPVNDTVNEEHETFTVTINAGTGYTVGTPSTLTVTIIDNDPPAAPSGLSLTAGNAKLTASWTKPAGPVAGYQLRYKQTSATDQTATTANDPSTGWVTSTPSGTGTSADITGLTNATAYHVQVRATDGQTQTGNGYGDWSASQSGTPAVPTVAAPTSLQVSAGNAQLSLTWTAPTGTLT